MVSRFRLTRGTLLKTLAVVAGTLLLALVPFWVGSAEETPSVEEVRIQVERMFASEGSSALPLGSDSAANQQSSPER